MLALPPHLLIVMLLCPFPTKLVSLLITLLTHAPLFYHPALVHAGVCACLCAREFAL
jgi:hypothetical protein